MKSRVILFIAVSAVVTLSFTFSATKRQAKKETKESSSAQFNEQLGGLTSEGKL